jgi:alcohol dehydrogenase (NADP+)
MATDYKFQGWLGHDPDSVNGKMVWGEFEPKKWTEDDVDVKITHCGICGSDLHTLRSGWGPTPYRKQHAPVVRVAYAICK